MRGFLPRLLQRAWTARDWAKQWLDGYSEAQQDVLQILSQASDVPLERRLRDWAGV